MLTPKHILTVIVFLLISLFSFSQDSLETAYKKKFQKVKHDTIKVGLFLELADSYHNNGQPIEKSMNYAEKALTVSEKLNYINGIAKSSERLAFYNRQSGDYKEGIRLTNKALTKLVNHSRPDLLELLYIEKGLNLSLSEEIDSLGIVAKKLLKIVSTKENLLKAHILLAGYFFHKDRFKEAVEEYILVMQIAEETDNLRLKLVALSNIASIYKELENLDEALKYADEIIKITDKNGFKNLYGFAHIVKGQYFHLVKDYDKAIECYMIAEHSFDEISDFYQKALIVYMIGNSYHILKNYKTTLDKYHEALKLAKEIEQTFLIHKLNLNLADLYYDMGKIDSASIYIELGKEALTTTDPKSIQHFHSMMAQISRQKGEYKSAYNHLLRYITMKDSLGLIQQKKEAQGIEIKYQFDKKEQEIATLNAENQVKTLQFYLAVGSGALVLLFLGFVYYRFKLSIKTKNRLIELDKAKSKFFANISHEFRTPLSLMMSPIQQKMHMTENESEKQEFMMMYSNGERLRKLIDQLLDLSKIEANDMPLNVQKADIVETTKILYSFFITRAEEKNIQYTINFHEEGREGYIDKDKLEKIVVNLLSNAFKFTPEAGKINVSLTLDSEQLLLVIEDTGIGIPADKINHIFDRFYQVDDSVTKNSEGSGIGLALSKELALLHKGNLTAKSEFGKGSVFTLHIPVSKQSYRKDEIIPSVEQSCLLAHEGKSRKLAIANPVFDKKSNKPWVLVAEDNPDMQSLIYSILKKDYEVILTANGMEAYEKAVEMIPDIIVSDYMMPEMDGLTLCKKIKNHDLIQHIPFVMLTAKAGQESKLHGLEHGADFYLTKPFDNNELLLIIQNIVDHQKRLKEHFIKQYSNSSAPEIPVREKEFIEKMNKIFEDKYSNTDYGIDQLALDLCLSRMQLHRKIKSITGNSPGYMLRSFRINKAIELLCSSSLSIGEVAYTAGFKNQSSFTKTFKDLTGKTPSEYMAIHI